MTPAELTAWREKAGYSQIELAEILGVTNVSVSRWEHGTREIPSFLHLALECLEKKGGKTKKGNTKKEKEKEKEKEINHEGKHSEKR